MLLGSSTDADFLNESLTVGTESDRREGENREEGRTRTTRMIREGLMEIRDEREHKRESR